MSGTLKGEGIVAVLARDEHFLLIQRAAHIRAGGQWCFVGGEINPGESQADALVREVREEIGVVITPGVKVWECLSPKREFLLHCWTADLVTTAIRPNPAEVADFKWMTAAEIARWPDTLPSVLGYLSAAGLLCH